MGPFGGRNTEAERFELLDLLGKGGFAETHKARVLDEDLREDYGTEVVALKIPLDREKERVLTKELEKNAMLHLRLKDIQSTNLVRYLGFCVFQGKVVMAMEYVGGGALRDRMGRIGRQKALPLEQAAEIAEGILRGLVALHREHVFHRDIKPENILMDGRVPKIADMGISTMLETMEQASTTAGTLFYMAPEIFSVEGATFSADLWSVGVTLYEMVSGELPIGGKGINYGQLMVLIQQGKVTPIRNHTPDLPDELEAIITKALQKDPAQRFRSAEEMADALRAWREGTSEEANAELDEAKELLANAEPTPGVEAGLRKLVAKYPKEPRAFRYLADYFNRGQRFGDAISTLKEGILQAPHAAHLHWDLGLTYQRIGKKAEAAACLEEAMKLGLEPGLQRSATVLLALLKGS